MSISCTVPSARNGNSTGKDQEMTKFIPAWYARRTRELIAN